MANTTITVDASQIIASLEEAGLPAKSIKELIREEVARQLKDIRHLPLDELAEAIGQKLTQQTRLHGKVRN